MDISELKKKLRKLKKEEARMSVADAIQSTLVWDSFFCTKNVDADSVRYSMRKLLQMDKEQFRAVIDEYFFSVYYRKLKVNGIRLSIYDPDMLSLLGLSPFSTEADIKKRFRELAKIYHPDQKSGDAEKMVDLLDIYNKLMEK